MPSTTMSAGSSPPSVATAVTRPSRPVSNPETGVPARTWMPIPSIASRTRAPMSGSSVVIGSGAWSTSVTSRPRRTMASAISTPM
jgi:hypothetical protein